MPRTPTARSKRGGASQRRLSARRPENDDEIPAVYQEMLAEAEAREPQVGESDRPIKRRRVQEQTTSSAPQIGGQEVHGVAGTAGAASHQIQTVYDSPSSDESDMEWEEVDLQPAVPDLASAPAESVDWDGSMQITLDPLEGQKQRVVPKRKPITAAERKMRLDIHKVHLLCLLRHVQIRNLWCNDEEVQGFLKRMLTKQVRSLLNPSEDKPQYTRSTTFIDGLNQASEAFMRRFKIIKSGLRRAHWSEDTEALKHKMEYMMSDTEVILSKEDFRKQAKTLQGSRDFGAQLFCALLRSVAVEARLVCSLQPLPFSGTTKDLRPSRPAFQGRLPSEDREASADENSPSKSSPRASRVRRIGRPEFKQSRPSKTVFLGARPSIRESAYPVFWVEAFNEAIQKWIPVDPLVTKSLAKSFKFEPPSSDPYNSLSYVVGFEEDASARDITRRYAKAFNAKTRQLRVESTKLGERWWARVMCFYEKPFLEDRDEVEISELTAKTAAEPMPRNVQDFKDHPIYALERHLRRNEVVHPKRVIGQVSLGKSGSKNQTLEPVYRRSDVHALRSANKWYRVGRDIKMGEQPLKRVPANKNASVAIDDDERDEESMETPLYAHFQTELYTPPPIVNGKVPKNAYGNLDVYVPTMVPPGGVHVKHSEAARAARILGIDFADAVTGFDFKGRHGTAVFQGIVIASEYREALDEILNGLEELKLQSEQDEKSAEILRLWKQFLLRLRIAERVRGYAIEGEEAVDEADVGSNMDFAESEEHLGGGFLPESPAKVSSLHTSIGQATTMSEPFSPGKTISIPGPNILREEESGGFILDEKDDEPQQPNSVPKGKSGEKSQYTLVVIPKKEAPEEDLRLSSALEHKDTERVSVDLARDQLPGSLEAPILVESSTAPDSKSASVEIISRPVSQAQSRAESPEESGRESESNEGSLLSQDPEDEDAIPEWLMSD
ncbi:hypothetical protein BDV59DRAFT_174419 [Aspergillus ambiguus]|uniref:putative DNA repair protein Rad4 n=1 Tax=Aspergillus ambiguus TaxID=176160 RepID=UPI003CCCD56C